MSPDRAPYTHTKPQPDRPSVHGNKVLTLSLENHLISTRRKTRRDAWYLTAFVLISAALAVRYDLLELLVAWAGQYEKYEVDELFSVLIFASLAMIVFTFRRRQDYIRQLQALDRASNSLQHTELLDAVTALPNRTLGKQMLAKELARCARDNSEVAVFAIDIDRFKHLNEAHGQHFGDEVLRSVAACLNAVVRDMDTLVRMGADEFMIIQTCIKDVKTTVPLVQRLERQMSQAFQVQGESFDICFSIGIAVSSDQHRSVDDLLRHSQLALSRAKLSNGTSTQYFEFEMDALMLERQRMVSDLRAAIDEQAFILHYQPLFNVNSKELLGFEALLRWIHPERGSISPAEFIPVAEDTGLIVPLGEWVLECACADAMLWSGEHKVAVNLSPVQFRDASLPAKVAGILEKTGLAPGRLELEITEGVLVHDVDTALQMLLELKSLGLRISMDDFGTGYSSLSYLKRFPFDKIKIDRSFVGQLETDTEDAAIVRAILAMGHSLGMTATAEGVESDAQLSYLLREGCEEAQGFLLGRPMPFAQALSLTELKQAETARVVVHGAAANDNKLDESGGIYRAGQ